MKFANKAEYAAELIAMGYDGRFPAILNEEEKQILGMDNNQIQCGYRCPLSGKKCVAGILIQDDEYQVSFEGMALTWIAINIPDWISFQEAEELQRNHDMIAARNQQFGDSWKEKVNSILGFV